MSRVGSLLRVNKSESSGNKQWVLLDARSWHRMRAFYWLRCLPTVVFNQIECSYSGSVSDSVAQDKIRGSAIDRPGVWRHSMSIESDRKDAIRNLPAAWWRDISFPKSGFQPASAYGCPTVARTQLHPPGRFSRRRRPASMQSTLALGSDSSIVIHRIGLETTICQCTLGKAASLPKRQRGSWAIPPLSKSTGVWLISRQTHGSSHVQIVRRVVLVGFRSYYLLTPQELNDLFFQPELTTLDIVWVRDQRGHPWVPVVNWDCFSRTFRILSWQFKRSA